MRRHDNPPPGRPASEIRGPRTPGTRPPCRRECLRHLLPCHVSPGARQYTAPGEALLKLFRVARDLPVAGFHAAGKRRLAAEHIGANGVALSGVKEKSEAGLPRRSPLRMHLRRPPSRQSRLANPVWPIPSGQSRLANPAFQLCQPIPEEPFRPPPEDPKWRAASRPTPARSSVATVSFNTRYRNRRALPATIRPAWSDDVARTGFAPATDSISAGLPAGCSAGLSICPPRLNGFLDRARYYSSNRNEAPGATMALRRRQ